MRYLSLFSGIEAAGVAWKQLGWECAAVCEILDYQSSVIKHHFPDVKNLHDITNITDDDIKSLGKLDVVVFGSPCQNMSVAGKREGLDFGLELTEEDDTNHSSSLFYEGMRVFRLAQKYCGARFLLWENVPGALSSHKGEDFGKILEEMVGGKFVGRRPIWGNEGAYFGSNGMCEWSVLDSQWFGVAQRRRRLFIVLDCGNWEDRQPILLEPETVRGNSPPSRETKKGTSTSTKGSVNKTSCFDMQAFGEYGTKDVASTLKARDYKDATDLIIEYTCAIAGNIIGRNTETKSGGNGTGYNEDVMYTLTATDHHVIVDNAKVRRLTPIECERLQGLEDDYTNINGASFTKRINALGRSMAVPVMKWIGQQIERSIK